LGKEKLFESGFLLMKKRIGLSQKIIIVFTLTSLVLIVFYPLFMMLLNSFGINQKTFNPTIDYYVKAFNNKGFFKALINTLVLALAVTLFSFAIGGSLAFLVKRTDMIFKKLIRRFALISFVIPSYIMAMSWIQLTTKNGLLSFLNIEIYSLYAVGFVMTLHLYPMAFLAISNALSKTDVSVEDFSVSLEDGAFGTKSVEIDKVIGKATIADADIVVSAGRGLKGPENWGMVEELADVLGAATACSKPVSDLGWRPHGEHVGQTGKPVASNLYIAIGISGAIQHLAGVSSSKIKVVINTDPEAPFFKAADYGVVGDAFEVVPTLIEKLKAFKAQNA
jgi:hypothetical protein